MYELTRRELSLLSVPERDAQQSAYRDFLLAVHGPVHLTWMVSPNVHRLFLWIRDHPENVQALQMLPIGNRPIGPKSPDALCTVAANPGLPPIARPAGRVPVRPSVGSLSPGLRTGRAHLRLLESGTGFRQLMAVETYPEFLDELSLERLWAYTDDVVVSLRLSPLPPAEARRRLDRRLGQLHAGSYLRRQRGHLPDPESEKAQADALSLRQALVEGRERLFATSFLVACDGPDRSTCEMRAAKMRALFAEMGFGLRIQLGLQHYAEDWLLPEYGVDEPPARLLSASTASCLYLVPAAAPPADGDLLGHHIGDGSAVLRPRLYAPNPLAVVLGQPGHGKSAFVKAELLRNRPDALLVVDPEGEYGPVVQALGGTLRSSLPPPGNAPGKVALSLRAHDDRARPQALKEAAAWAFDESERLGQRIPLWLTLDEAHLWLGTQGAEQSLLDLAKRARKRGLIVTVVTQNVGDFLRSVSGRLVLANAGRLVLFRQQPADLPPLGESAHLSDRALDFLRGCSPGEALLVDEAGPTPLRFHLTKEALQLVDTRPAFARPR